MSNHNLYRITNFAEKNKSFSDFNIVNKFKLNFNKYKTNSKIQIGGAGNSDGNQQQTNETSKATEQSNSNQEGDKQQTNDNQAATEQTNGKQEGDKQQTNETPKATEQTNGNQEGDKQQTNGNQAASEQTNGKQEGDKTNETPKATEQPNGKQEGDKQPNGNQEGDKQQTNGNSIPSKENISLDTPTSKSVDKISRMNDSNLVKPDFISDEIKTYTIEKGTILFFSTVDKRGFNTNTIKLHGNESKDLISFFTPNFRLASDKIQGCSVEKQKGYIHVFRVKQEIPNIFIKLPYDTDDDISLDNLFSKFCTGSNSYNGIGFFYPKNEIETFNNIQTGGSLSDNNYYSEFGLCNPGPFLEYLYTQKCMSLRKLSEPYRFDN